MASSYEVKYFVIYYVTCKLDFQYCSPYISHQDHMVKGHTGQASRYIFGFHIHIGLDSLDHEHIQGHSLWLCQVWELNLADI